MPYQIESGIWSSVFAVPAQIVDRHIRLCGPLSLKVLLVMLRNGGGTEPEQLAEILGQSAADVRDALGYWAACGIVRHIPDLSESGAPDTEMPPVYISYANTPPASTETPILSYTVEEDTPKPEKKKEGRKVAAVSGTRPRFSVYEINIMAESDTNIAALLQESQLLFGKPLTPHISDLVAAMYSYYGFAPEAVLMLIQYCLSIGKENARYIEKVAADWCDRGVITHEKADEEIRRLTKERETESQIKRVLCIYDRDLITKERDYIRVWTQEYAMDKTLIGIAYEKSVESTGRRNLAYIDKILASWHRKNIKTAAEALRESDQGKKGKKGASYELSEFEDMLSGGKL
ncbi:MAG: DnaD domain protein [Oscillospiraceae bacterium]|nr:DnaD domain protein [Oscillospiraceae bacterium]